MLLVNIVLILTIVGLVTEIVFLVWHIRDLVKKFKKH